MLAAFPDLVVRIDLTVVNSFQEPVVLVAGAAAKRANQVDDILVVYSLVLELVNELPLGQSATEEPTKSPLEGGDAPFSETGPAQSYFVNAADL